MLVHWESVAAAMQRAGQVVVLVDFWRADERSGRREEVYLDPDSAVPLVEQLRQKVRERAESIALASRAPVLDELVKLRGDEEV